MASLKSAPRGPRAESKLICPFVMVPVLSVTSTSTPPRSSMHMSCFTSTLFLASIRDPAVREVETRTGRSSGVIPIATENANRAEEIHPFPRRPLIIRISSVPMKATIMRKLEYFLIPI